MRNRYETRQGRDQAEKVITTTDQLAQLPLGTTVRFSDDDGSGGPTRTFRKSRRYLHLLGMRRKIWVPEEGDGGSPSHWCKHLLPARVINHP